MFHRLWRLFAIGIALVVPSLGWPACCYFSAKNAEHPAAGCVEGIPDLGPEGER